MDIKQVADSGRWYLVPFLWQWSQWISSRNLWILADRIWFHFCSIGYQSCCGFWPWISGAISLAVAIKQDADSGRCSLACLVLDINLSSRLQILADGIWFHFLALDIKQV